jgi:hypothetical protein
VATGTFLASGGGDRLVVSTICTHLVFFHEAGFEYRTERRRRVPVAWWNPASWRGYRWARSNDAEQPRKMRCTFNQDADPSDFGATPQAAPGFLKLTCESLSIRRHCVWVAVGEPTPRGHTMPAGHAAQDVRDVVLNFVYDGKERMLRHSAGAK